MSIAEDLDAIDQYMRTTAANTPKASLLRTNYMGWFDNLGWFAKNFDNNSFLQARQYRNDFNLANATTPQAKEQVQAVIDKGMTTDDMMGTGTKSSGSSQPSRVVSHPTIRLGSKGDAVKEWQNILQDNGHDKYGDFGPGTKLATKVFQKGHGLKQDGVVGPKTWMAAYVSNTAQTGAALPGAVVDSEKKFPPAISPKSSDVAKKVAQGGMSAYPAVYDKPIGQPVPASKVKAAMAGMLNPTGWTTGQKAVGGFFALLAAYFGIKHAQGK